MTLDRITVNPDIMQGKPCVRGMRITVGLVVNLVASGMSTLDILRNYPDLEDEDIRQCLRYAASLAEERAYRSQKSGEEGGRPMRRQLGWARGILPELPATFFDPLPDEILDLFEGKTS